MPTTLNMSLVLPTISGDPGVWGTKLNAALTLVDTHDHTTGKGVKVPSSGLNINADLSFAGNAATNLEAAAFAGVASFSTNKSLWVDSDDNELYWRSNGGVNVKVTSGGQLNISLVGGIAGDYSAAAAQVYYDDAAQAYRFLEAAPSPNSWSYVKAGGIDVYEHASGIANFVGLRSPAALAASYNLTFPAALPGSTVLAQVSSAGVITFSNTITNAVTFSGLTTHSAGATMAADQHVTVSGNGKHKHGNRVLPVPASAFYPGAGAADFGGGTVPYLAGPQWQFAATTGASNRILYATVSLPAGARVRSVKFWFQRGSGTLLFDVIRTNTPYADTTLSSTSVSSGTSEAFETHAAIDRTIGTDEMIYLRFQGGSATDVFMGAFVTFDEP